MKKFKQLIEYTQTDVIGMAEMNRAWNRLEARHQIDETTQGWKEHFPRTSLAYFKKKTHTKGTHVYGGTATMAFHTVRDCSRERGSDSKGMGRWSWMRFHGRGGASILIVSAYRPCNSRQGDDSVWAQQRTRLQQLDITKDPREQFLLDLAEEVQQWWEEGDQIALGIDLNSDVIDISARRGGRDM